MDCQPGVCVWKRWGWKQVLVIELRKGEVAGGSLSS